MKYFVIPILLISLTALNYFSEDFVLSNNSYNNELNLNKTNLNYNRNNENQINSKNITVYNCDLKFLPDRNVIVVESKITWKNNTNFPANNIYFNFDRNMKMADANPLSNKKTEVHITEFSCSKQSSTLLFDKTKSKAANGYWERVDFNIPVLPNDSVTFFVKYKLPISASFDSTNYKENKKVFIDDHWYPRIPIFKNGKWEIFPKSIFTKEFRDFADFHLNISAPVDYNFITSGKITDKKKKNGSQQFKIVGNRVSDFVIIVANNSNILENKYQIKNNINIELSTYLTDNSKNYLSTIEKAAYNSFNYLNKNIGNYPHKNFKIVYLPKAVMKNNPSFSNVIVINNEKLFSGNSYNLEVLIANKIIEQYFHFIVGNNSQTEAWLSDGISKYIAEKIKTKYYKKDNAMFKFLKYISVNGLQFISYKDIPLVYTLGDYQISPETLSLKDYYSGYMTGSISDSSYLFNAKNSYELNSIHKPFLLLLSLERIIGAEKTNSILREYYSDYGFSHPYGADLLKIIAENSNALTSNYVNQVYNGFDYYDLKIKYLKNNYDNIYEIALESRGHCTFETEIYIYRNNDTLKFKWNTAEKWKVIRFESDKEVFAAEIDPAHKFIFDPNYSNNSFTISRMNWSSISISIRWFFWIQNALMILGSAA